jgi:hypothetical protein
MSLDTSSESLAKDAANVGCIRDLSCDACVQGFGHDHALQGFRPGSRSDATFAQLLLLEPDLL